MLFEELRNVHAGEEVYIVGRGPSLQYLKEEHFIGQRPIICINETIAIVQDMQLDNPVYSLQKDCCKWQPKENVTLILQNSANFSGNCYPDHPKRILVDPVFDLHLELPQAMSIQMAICISRYMGCSFLHLISCDILVDRLEFRSFNVEAKQVILEEGNKWYRCSRIKVLKQLKGIPHAFITPS